MIVSRFFFCLLLLLRVVCRRRRGSGWRWRRQNETFFVVVFPAQLLPSVSGDFFFLFVSFSLLGFYFFFLLSMRINYEGFFFTTVSQGEMSWMNNVVDDDCNFIHETIGEKEKKLFLLYTHFWFLYTNDNIEFFYFKKKNFFFVIKY